MDTISVASEHRFRLRWQRPMELWSRAAAALTAAAVVLLAAMHAGLNDGKNAAGGFRNLEIHHVERPPWSMVPKVKDHEELLLNAEVRFRGQIQGPESIAFDPQGKGPYTGVADGCVVFWDGHRWIDFAHTSPFRSKECEPKASVSGYAANEHICGRPLGLRFDNRTGELYIADAYFGILKVGSRGGLATQVTTEAEGLPFKFTNDLDIDEQGNVYFTDSSSNFHRRNYLQLLVSAEPSGRLLKYDSTTKETTVLLRDLQFPNGVALSADGTFLVFCDGAHASLIKYWLKGEKTGKTEVFAILPGFPDNVKRSEDGNFWVAIHKRIVYFNHLLSIYPRLRKALTRLPIPAATMQKFLTGGIPHGLIVKYDAQGKILKVLEDSKGEVVRSVSHVEEKNGKLWLGSVLMPFIAVYG